MAYPESHDPRAAPAGAVFLSYASQDAAAVKGLCAALRAAGVEVWFDQNELVGGDAWDAKIRGQIKACALFVPVISAATQARREGYFRIEWKLAAQRTQAMADGTPFLLPVVIDGTRDGEALVPEEFRAVQWTRLAGGGASAAFVARVAKLLGAGVAQTSSPPPSTGPGSKPPPPARKSPRPALLAAAVGFFVLVGLMAVWRPWQTSAAVPPASSAAPSSAFPRDPDLKRAFTLVNAVDANLEDFTLAEEIAKPVVERRSMDAEALTIMARVHLAYIYRGFDGSDERRALARRFSERAVQLAPEDSEALAALGVYHSAVRGGDAARAVELLERAIRKKPDDPFLYRSRDQALFADPKVATPVALASAEQTAARFPGDALAHYELARRYRDVGRITDMERELDRAIALHPLGNALMWKARIALYVRGDPAEMKALLDRVPARLRSVERVVFGRWAHAMVTGNFEEGLNALEALTAKWIEDFDYAGPPSLLAAQLLTAQAKPELARLQYQTALTEIRARQARAPGDATLRVLEAWVMHGLGRNDEARNLNRVALESLVRPYRLSRLSNWWFTSIPICLLSGDRANALQNIREAVTLQPADATGRRIGVDGLSPTAIPDSIDGARMALRLRFKVDPRMAPWRDDPEIAALLAEPAPR